MIVFNYMLFIEELLNRSYWKVYERNVFLKEFRLIVVFS